MAITYLSIIIYFLKVFHYRNNPFRAKRIAISVGYRVNSQQAIPFRIRATEQLWEYIIKGSTMDDERFKNPQKLFGKDYVDEQLARFVLQGFN